MLSEEEKANLHLLVDAAATMLSEEQKANLHLLADTAAEKGEEVWLLPSKREEESKISSFEDEENHKRNFQLPPIKISSSSSSSSTMKMKTRWEKQYLEDQDQKQRIKESRSFEKRLMGNLISNPQEHLNNNNGVSTSNVRCFDNPSLYNFNTLQSEKKKDLASSNNVESLVLNSSTSSKRLYMEQRKSNDGLNKAKVAPLRIVERKTKDPPSSNDVKSSPSPSLYLNERKRKIVFKKPKIDLNPSVERKVPDWVIQIMRNINRGSDGENVPKVIFETTLSVSDVSPNQSRLLIPFNNLINKDFLTPNEDEAINKKEKNKGVDTILYNERSEKWNLSLKKWPMKKKDSKKQTLNYALNAGWNDFVKCNNLKVGDKIRLWSFRCNGVLCFALEIMSRAGP